MPEGPRAARIAEVERHLADTHFCWIGGFSEDSPFYYRVQSPVVFIEFDHHAGVFLTNAEPAKFHVHTIVRTPNGNDYGIDLLRLHYEHAPHHQHHHHHGDAGTGFRLPLLAMDRGCGLADAEVRKAAVQLPRHIGAVGIAKAADVSHDVHARPFPARCIRRRRLLRRHVEAGPPMPLFWARRRGLLVEHAAARELDPKGFISFVADLARR